MSINQNLTDAQRLEEGNQRLRLPIRAVISRPLPELEAVEVDMALEAGTNKMKVHHPYYSANSWIRVMPEVGTAVFTLQRGDSVHNEIIGYDSSGAAGKIRAYKKDIVLFRPLYGGEMELMSSGRAYIYLGNGGDIEMRGGTVRQELLQSRLELRSIAPTYAKRTHRSIPNDLINEERFGIVKRPDLIFSNSMQQYIRSPINVETTISSAKAVADAISSGATALDIANAGLPEFAVEYARWLNMKSGKELASYQEGFVVDILGMVERQSSTNKTLRSRRTLSHVLLGELKYEVDEELNIYFANNSTAIETKVDLGLLNALKLSSKDVKLLITKTGQMQFGASLLLKAPSTTIDAPTLLTGKSARIHMNAPDVGFGASPVLPIALAAPTINSLSTALGTIQSFITVVGANAGNVAIATAATTATAAISVTLSTLSQIASKQVKATG